MPDKHKAATIIVVDDEPVNITILKRFLARAGLGPVFSTSDPREAAALCREHPPDLVLLDFNMPHLDGVQLLEQLRELMPDAHVPMIVLTGDINVETRTRALQAGAVDFLTKPFDSFEVMLRIKNHLEVRSLYVEMEDRVRERTCELEETYQDMLARLAQAAEFRDDETGQHTRRVGDYSAKIAAALGMTGEEVKMIRRAAPLHDVGKIAIPDGILLSEGRLSPEEMAVMRTHTTIGARLLSGGGSPQVVMAERIALNHHERWDGGGYPHGIAGEAIPIEGRIVALADFFDALSQDRRYRPAWPRERVLAEIVQQTGKHFDPAIVEAFMRTLEPATGTAPA